MLDQTSKIAAVIARNTIVHRQHCGEHVPEQDPSSGHERRPGREDISEPIGEELPVFTFTHPIRQEQGGRILRIEGIVGTQ
jgi:hypothetical protein